MATVEIKGLSELGEALKDFPVKMAAKYLRLATSNAAAVFRDEAKAHAPVLTGEMRDAIAIFKKSSPDPYTAHYAVGVGRIRRNKKVKRVLSTLRKAGVDALISGDVFYWRFVEFGTSKMKAKPFLRPAFESKKMDAIEMFRQTLADSVAKLTSDVKR